LSRLIRAEFRAQCGQDLFAARHSVAARFQPLEFGQKIAARRRRQLLQIVLNRIDLYHRKRHFRSLDRNQRSVRREQVRPCGDATTKTVCAGLRSKSDAPEIMGLRSHVQNILVEN
jgi:hypothetical protein